MKPIQAVTVSKNCLERTKYSIKYLSVGKRKTGRQFWFVCQVGPTDTDKHDLEGKAIMYAITHVIPFIPSILNGEHVSTKDLDRLKKYGVAV